MRHRARYEAIMKVSCSTCPRALKYRGYSMESQKDAEDEAINEALKKGWVLVGVNIHCPACVRAGRGEEEEDLLSPLDGTEN